MESKYEEALESVFVPDVVTDIYNALCKKLVMVEANVKEHSMDPDISLFKDPDRKKLIEVDAALEPLPLIFTAEEQEAIIHGIYDTVEQCFYSYVYICGCDERWMAEVGLYIFLDIVLGYKDEMVKKVLEKLRLTVIGLDVFDNQKSAIASIFLTDRLLFSPALEPLKKVLERCSKTTKILGIARDPSESDEN